MNDGISAFAASIVEMPSSRSSLTSRSCSVRCARSTRPLAAGVFAQIPSMLSSSRARPNCVWPSPPVADLRFAPEDTGLVTVERQRLAVTLQILSRGLKVRERRLSAREQDDHQSARRIIDIHQRRARRCPVLEPVMVTAINLDQFTQTCASRSRLLNLWRSQLARQPQPARTISERTVSTARSTPWRSRSFSAANVGPKSA